MTGRRRNADDAERPPEDEARLYGRALRLLAAHDRTAADLRTRLGRYGEPGTVARVIARLEAQRYLDDRRFAEAYTEREALTRGAGARLVRAGLRSHGVAEDVVMREAERASSAELETARAVARRALPRLSGLEPPVRARRLAGQLARRGYAASVVYQVVREALRGAAALGGEAEAVLDGLAAADDLEGSDPSAPGEGP